ncbi:MAG: histidine kinase [Flavobacteriaceae bacterium]|nr:histidine kinase [Flavobacteriaceae bacterium]|tara:strand:+ start:6086 stop:7435 length:1350 start_codon:yes stop_codon:yes gene_type:complete
MVAAFSRANLRSGFIVSFKITLIFTAFFVLFNQNFTLKGMGYTFIISALYSFGLGFGQGLINDLLSEKWSWTEETNIRVWAGIISTVLYTIPVVLGINYFTFIIVNGNDPDQFFKGNFLFIHLFYIFLSFGVSAFLHARGFMIGWKKAVKQESTQQQIVAKTETAKFQSLKSQIDPHFLFNSLNVLTSLIGENPNAAERFTTKLSKVYRYVLEQRNKDLIPLTEELNFAKTYMELLQMRFEDAIQFSVPASVSNGDLKVVPLSLQLLLENAVKHNVVSSSRPLIINIYEEDGYLVVENNINPKEAIGKSTKVGLQNIADRYGLITERRVSIENNKKTFAVRLPLLYKMQNIMYQDDLENSKYVRAAERVEKLKEFYQNLTTYCIMMPILIFINVNYFSGFYWFWFPLVGWGIGVLFHGLEAYNYSPFLGSNWEERKIKEIMDRESRNRF